MAAAFDFMQSTTSAAISPLLITFYEKVGLERLLPRLRFAQFADKKPLPKGNGKTIQWYRFTVRAAVTSNLAEMVPPTRGNLSAGSISATLIQRGGYVAISDLLEMTAIDPIIKDASAQMGEEAARSVDRYIKDIVTITVACADQKSSITHGVASYGTRGATQRLWAGLYVGGTWGMSFPMLVAKARLHQCSLVASFAATGLTVSMVNHASHFLRTNNAMPFDDGKYVGIIHPEASYNLSRDPSWKSWHQYTTPEAMYKGEIGEIFGVRFVESTDAPKFALSGDTTSTTVSGVLFGTLIVGKHAYGVTEIDGGFKIFVNEAGSAGSVDPLHQINTVGWKATLAAKVLNKSAGCIIISTSTAALGC